MGGGLVIGGGGKQAKEMEAMMVEDDAGQHLRIMLSKTFWPFPRKRQNTTIIIIIISTNLLVLSK
jgi:hypothetical protein